MNPLKYLSTGAPLYTTKIVLLLGFNHDGIPVLTFLWLDHLMVTHGIFMEIGKPFFSLSADNKIHPMSIVLHFFLYCCVDYQHVWVYFPMAYNNVDLGPQYQFGIRPFHEAQPFLSFCIFIFIFFSLQ